MKNKPFARQGFRKYLLFSFCISFILVNSHAESELRFDTVEITLYGENIQKELKASPLWGNKDVAFSARWDDSHRNHPRMRDAMAKHGLRGTFYVNGARKMDFKALATKGSSLGSHSMTHPRLAGWLNYNRMFWEVAACRAIVEADSDQALNGYCFSDGNYYRMVQPKVGPSIVEMLERCGYHFNVTKKFVQSLHSSYKGREPVSSVVYATAGDSSPSMEKFEKRLAELMADQSWKSENPNISMGVHAWIHNQQGWDDLDKIFAKVAHKPNWWYSNQTDYAAYRKILRLHKLELISQKAHQVRYRLKLPYASDIGSNVPFTLMIDQALDKVQINGKDVELVTKGNKTIFDVNPQAKAMSPTLIHYFENPKNVAIEAVSEPKGNPILWANLRISENEKKAHKLQLQLKTSSSELSQIRVKYILPLMYNNLSSNDLDSLPEGLSSIERELSLHPEEEYHWGQAYLLCQVDYLHRGKPERIFVSCLGRKQFPPIQVGFRDGSMVSSTFQMTDKIKRELIVMTSPDMPLLDTLAWSAATEYERLHYNESTIDILQRLGLEQINEARKTNSKQYYATLWTLDNTNGKKYLFAKNNSKTIATIVNGQEVLGKDKLKIPLKKGENKILIISSINAQTVKRKVTFSLIFRN